MTLRILLPIALLLIVCAPPVAARGTHSVCPTCKGKRQTIIERDSSWPRARRTQEKMDLWCSWCHALGVYDGDVKVGPCVQCGSFPNPAKSDGGFPSYYRGALETQLEYWWKEHGAYRPVFMITPTMTLSCALETMELNLTGRRNYMKERARVAEHCPGTNFKKTVLVGRHERAHMYIQRMIDAYETCNEAVGVATSKEDDYYRITVERIDFLVFNSNTIADQFSAKHGGIGRYRGTQIHAFGATGNDTNADDLLWGLVIHNLGHHWCDRLWGGIRDREPLGWIYNGMAHYTEMLNFGEPVNKCDNEYNKGMQWTKSRWRTRVFKDLKKKEIQLQSVLTQTKEAQGFMDHVVSWSVIDFLSKYSKKKFAKLVSGLAHDKPIAQALRESHGWTTNLLEIHWIKYVEKNYRSEPRKPKVR